MQDIPQMTIVTWIVVGAIAGFVASVIAGSREGLLMMVLLGIVGAVVAAGSPIRSSRSRRQRHRCQCDEHNRCPWRAR